MKQLFSLLLALDAVLLVTAQNQTPQDFCTTNFGATYSPVFETDGSFAGNCVQQASNICLGTEFPHPKTGATICCMGTTVLKSDASKEAGCCEPAKDFKWDPATSTGWCVAPPPPPPAISCPGSNGATVSKYGVTFKVFCGRNVREWVNPFDVVGKLNALANINRVGTAVFDDCLDICARDSKCQGANWWIQKGGCGINNKPPGGLFNQGSYYELPPPVSWIGGPVISIVAVPKR